MAKDAVFIYPPIRFGSTESFTYPPMGIIYIATYAKKMGLSVKFIDSLIEGGTKEEIVASILNEHPKIVCFSTMTCQIHTALKLATEIKETNKNIKIVFGGSHISSTKEELFHFTKDVDYLMYGEAEKSFYELYNSKSDEDLSKISGLIYRAGDTIKINPNAPIQDLDELPFPDLGLTKLYAYNGYYVKTLPVATIMGTRGCPFRCTFCDQFATMGREFRFRSPKNIVDEIEFNHNTFSVRDFVFKDSTFTCKKEWVYDICKEIINRGIKINWSCNTRVSMVDASLLKAMKDAGCYMIAFGIEAGAQHVLNLMKKGTTVQQAYTATRLCKEAGIEATGYFMIGNPGESEEDALKTIQLSKEIDLDYATFGVTIAYPNTEIYHWALQNNCLSDRQWYMKESDTDIVGTREINGGALDREDFPVQRQIELCKKANKEFYFRPSYIIKKVGKIRSFSDITRNLRAAAEII
ncbi:MAG: radical SAM protein [Nanoarchaeota archaeon]